MLRSRMTDPTPQKIAKSIAKCGHEVTLLMWNRKGMRKDEVTRPDDNCNIELFNLRAPLDKPTALLYLPFWWLYSINFLLWKKCDVIHACDLDCLLPAIPVAVIRRKKLYYSIEDFYANNVPGSGRAVGLVRDLLAALERHGIRFSDVLFIADDSRVEEVKGARTKRMYVIYNSPPEVLLAKKSPDDAELTVFYGGILTEGRGINVMISAVNSMTGIKLIIGGVGPEERHIAKVAQGSEKITYLGWIESYSKLIELTNSSDVIFRFSDPNIPKTRFESPNKLFEAMMCGKPIIVSDESAMADIVRREKCGKIVRYGDVDGLKDALESMKDPALRERLGGNGRYAYESKYNWAIMERKIQEAYSLAVPSARGEACGDSFSPGHDGAGDERN